MSAESRFDGVPVGVWRTTLTTRNAKAITVSGLVTLIVFAAAATIGTATASAESCFATASPSQGAFTTSSCATAGPPLLWVTADETFNWQRVTRGRRPPVYCVKVQTGLRSSYEDPSCTKHKSATGEYSEAFAEAGFQWGIATFAGKGGTQVFGLATGPVECEEVTIGGKAAATEPKTQVFTAKYGKCKGLGSEVTVSEAEYELTAEGRFSVVKPVTITSSLHGCTVKLGGPKGLAEVNYTNTVGGKIVVNAEVGGIVAEGEGGACGSGSSFATYKGQLEIGQEGPIAVKLAPIAPAHYYKNGTMIAEGKKVPTVSFGTFTLTSAAGVLTCHSAIGGYVENPLGGGPGV